MGSRMRYSGCNLLTRSCHEAARVEEYISCIVLALRFARFGSSSGDWLSSSWFWDTPMITANYTTKHCVPLSVGLWHQKVSPSCFPSLPSQARRVKISYLVLRVSLFTLVQGAESGGCSCGSEGATDLALAHRNRMGR